MIWIGWNPTPFLERMEPSVRAVLERVEQFAPTAADAEASGGAVGPAAAPRAE
jgi:hypothetical protein